MHGHVPDKIYMFKVTELEYKIKWGKITSKRLVTKPGKPDMYSYRNSTDKNMRLNEWMTEWQNGRMMKNGQANAKHQAWVGTWKINEN